MTPGNDANLIFVEVDLESLATVRDPPPGGAFVARGRPPADDLLLGVDLPVNSLPVGTREALGWLNLVGVGEGRRRRAGEKGGQRQNEYKAVEGFAQMVSHHVLLEVQWICITSEWWKTARAARVRRDWRLVLIGTPLAPHCAWWNRGMSCYSTRDGKLRARSRIGP
ncbi:MAG: hypothetical protein GY856_46530 [bacterium]|nr:hypothetical protein [bacterium]